MIKWYSDLYLDPITKKYERRIVRRLQKGKKTMHIYCIALSTNGKDLLDILYTNDLLFHYYKNKEICILGLAATKESAVDISVQIVEELYQKTGGFNAHDYFFSQM